MAAATRLFKEYKMYKQEIAKNPELEDELYLEPSQDNIFSWKATIRGPSETPYAGGYYNLAIRVPQDYPLQPPNVTCLTKIFHPNIHFKKGEICLDTLKSSWTPAWSLTSVCRAIIALLASPDASSPLNCDCGNLMRCGDDLGYRSMARMYTELFALERQP